VSVAVVILAAGEARRFGSAKLVVPVDGVPLVRRAVLAALAVCTQVIVVTGAHREPVESCIADLAVERVFNAEWAEGLGGSIACGVAQLPSALGAAIILLADQPLIGASELRRLIDAHTSASERIIAAQFSGTLGSPCLFPRSYFAELTSLHDTQGARVVLQHHADQVNAVAMPEAAFDIDTVEDYTRMTKP
jgi:molybdenum cofactor cytidylyltransferase